VATILQMRLTERLREEMGGTYTVQARAVAVREPYPFYRVTVGYTSDPTRAKEMQEAVFAVVDSLRTYRPTDTELRAVKEEQRRAVETSRQQSSYWAGTLLGFVRNGWDLADISAEETLSESWTPELLKS